MTTQKRLKGISLAIMVVLLLAGCMPPTQTRAHPLPFPVENTEDAILAVKVTFPPDTYGLGGSNFYSWQARPSLGGWVVTSRLNIPGDGDKDAVFEVLSQKGVLYLVCISERHCKAWLQ